MYTHKLCAVFSLGLCGFLCAQSFMGPFKKLISSPACKDAELNRSFILPTPSLPTHGFAIENSADHHSLTITNTFIALGLKIQGQDHTQYIVNHLQFNFQNSTVHLFDYSNVNPVYACNDGSASKLCKNVADAVRDVLGLVIDKNKHVATRKCAITLASEFSKLSH